MRYIEVILDFLVKNKHRKNFDQEKYSSLGRKFVLFEPQSIASVDATVGFSHFLYNRRLDLLFFQLL